MQQDYTHIGMVLDASGSMKSLKEDTKGSFIGFLDAQRKPAGKTVFDLWQFNDKVGHIVDGAELATVGDDVMDGYRCSGMTAMNDAICTAIDRLGEKFAAMPETERPENVIVAIITDGHENASKEFTSDDVKKRIARQSEHYRWEFVFLAANQDAVMAGSRLGLAPDQCADFGANADGMRTVAAILADRTDRSRQNAVARRLPAKK